MSRVRTMLVACVVALVSAGCNDVCDRAIDVLGRRCGIETTRDPGELCEGEMQRVSECIVDHPDDACAYYDDPVAEGDNPFAVCAFSE